MTYVADRVFGSWLAYFERLGWEATKEACIIAARKYPHEADRISWAIHVMALGRIAESMATITRPSPSPRHTI